MGQLIPSCGPIYPDAGQVGPPRSKLAHVYLPYISRNSVKIMGVLYVILGRNIGAERLKFKSGIKLRTMNAKTYRDV